MYNKALVTGACGFSGSHMVDLLISQGYEVIATDRPTCSKQWLNPKAKFLPSDLTSYESMVRVTKNIDVIFHPAALFDYEATWETIKKVNVDGTKNLLEASLQNSVKRIIIWSTVSVYGGAKPEELPVKEDNPKRPATNYEKSKWQQELVAQEYMKKGLDITIIRPAPIYGPRNLYGFATLLFLLQNFPIVPNPQNLQNYMPSVHVSDVSHAAIYLMKRESSIGETYNVVDDSRLMIKDFIDFLAPLMGFVTLPIYFPRDTMFELGMLTAKVSKWIGDLFNQRAFLEQDMVYYVKNDYWFDNTKLKNLGYSFLYADSKLGIKETVEWMKQNGYLKSNLINRLQEEWENNIVPLFQ